jgi:uncharacterized protein (DUF1015 family)
MPRIAPFAGLLYNVPKVGPLESVTTPPYDVISPQEEIHHRNASAHNVVRLLLARQEPGDAGDADKYRRAASYLDDWRRQEVLIRDDDPRHYPYEMRFALRGRQRRVRGLICQVELEEWGGSILPHEEVMRAPVEDRLRLMRATRANLSAVYAVLSGPCRPLQELLDGAASLPPISAATDEAGVEHVLWSVPDAPGVNRWLADRELMIADGHHRYTMALRYRDEMRRRHGPGPWDHVMMLIVDATTEDPPVLPIHRLLSERVSVRGTLVRGTLVRDLEEVLSTVSDDSLTFGIATREAGELLHRVARLEGDPPLVCALHDQLLPETDPNDGLRFTHDAIAAEQAVRAGEAEAAIFLPPTTAERIRAVVDRGRRLPQKSTYFWPKPRTGMVMRPLE